MRRKLRWRNLSFRWKYASTAAAMVVLAALFGADWRDPVIVAILAIWFGPRPFGWRL